MTTTTRLCRPKVQRAGQRGVSMIELLVSLLIFTFGMLGLAGLQTRSLGLNQSSMVRSQATALIDDVLDRMRADRISALKGKWNTALGDSSTSITGTSFIYQTDLRDWKASVERLMPSNSGRSAIELVSSSTEGATVKITIEWDDSRGADTPQQFVITTRL